MPRVQLYSKPDCGLCAETRAILEKLRQEFALEIVEVDITRIPELYARYKETIPAVALEDGTVVAPALSEFRLRQALRGLSGRSPTSGTQAAGWPG